MNNSQKLFVMLMIGSGVVLIISASTLGFSPFGTWIDSSNVDISTEKYEKDTKIKVTDWDFELDNYRGWVERQKRKNGVYKTDFDFARLFRAYKNTGNTVSVNVNYLGIISFANMIISFVGYILFRKK